LGAAGVEVDQILDQIRADATKAFDVVAYCVVLAVLSMTLRIMKMRLAVALPARFWAEFFGAALKRSRFTRGYPDRP
jgi:hypothetical protein